MTLYTLSRQEVYDFERCPKIVAIRSYLLLHPKSKPTPQPRAQPEVPRIVIGRIGEAAVASAFSGAAAAAGSAPELKEVLASQANRAVLDIGAVVDAATKEILEQTVDGMAEIRDSLTSAFGELRVIGRGVCKNGPFPGDARPDFVALSPRLGSPVLIEVKNSPAPTKTDRFQASFYNTVANESGVVVHEERLEAGRLNLSPIAYHDKIAETVLVYPRGKHFEKAEGIDLGEEVVKEVWRAKQLGFAGKSPRTDCDSRCPHRKLGVELPEGDLEPASPLPLIYAKGLSETDYDMDDDYLRNYFFRSGLSSGIFGEVFAARNDLGSQERIIGAVSSKTGMSEDTVRRVLYSRQRTPDADKVLGDMADEVNVWRRLTEKPGSLVVDQTKIQGLATRFFTLPNGSSGFVNRSWKKWRT